MPEDGRSVERVAQEALRGPPVTGHESKKVMLRAERGDTIEIEGDKYEVIQRTNPYFGPKLKLSGPETIYLLTAPGPDRQLKLWRGITDDGGFREGWNPVGDVEAELVDTKKYTICEHCGEPIKNADHQRLALIGACEG